MLHKPDNTAAQSRGISRKAQHRRLWRIFWACELGMVGGLIINVQLEQWFAAWVCAGALIALCVVPWLLTRGRTELAGQAIILAITTVVTLLIWFGRGLHDEVMIAYPGILIYAVMAGSRKMFIWVFLLISVSLATLGIANEYDLVQFAPPEKGLVVALTIIMVFCVVAWATYLLSEDMMTATRNLESENRRFREAQQALHHLAHHDALTGLPNRVLARDRFELAYAQGQRDSTAQALLYLDLDHFKTINDTQGHPVGDQILIAVARRLKETLRTSDTVSRLSGDEFFILVSEYETSNNLTVIAEKIIAAIGTPLRIEDNEYHLSCSVGIAVAPADGSNFDTLLQKADTAMYQAKERGRGGFCFFDDSMNAEMREHMELVADLRTAIKEEQFEAWYQPLIHLPSNTCVAGEALLRWRHPEHGLMPPMRFIPLAEASGLISELGDWVLRRACFDCVALQKSGYERLHMSVNVSVKQFRQGGLADKVRACLEESGLEGKYLSLEVTESLLVEDDLEFMQELEQLRALGVGIALDDFGTGFSNLSFLKTHNFINIKIDKSFVSNILNNENEAAIFNAIVHMANDLGLHTVAEGVEDEATAIAVTEAGCTIGQGYHWSKPIPLPDFEAYLAEALNSPTAQATESASTGL